jgi:hypothetical protein
MKPILFLALLALGPALAEQFSVAPPRLAPAAADAAQASGTAPVPQVDAERTWLCRG